jgi:hypothetical protein
MITSGSTAATLAPEPKLLGVLQPAGGALSNGRDGVLSRIGNRLPQHRTGEFLPRRERRRVIHERPLQD